MGRPELKLILGAKGAPAPSTWVATAAIGGIVVLSGVLATILGADAARAVWNPRSVASLGLHSALENGAGSHGSREAALALRRRLGAFPVDADTRAAYASLLLELADSPEGRQAARFHAERAAWLAPVTVPVVSAAALVLARCREADRARALVRSMFAYDPPAAARLLIALEPLLDSVDLAVALPPIPAAWLAWSTELRRAGRAEDAEAFVRRAFAQWPRNPETVGAMAERAVARGDWKALGEILSSGAPTGRDAASCTVLAYRARFLAETGDRAGARSAAEDAARHAGPSVSILMLAGEAMAAANEPAGARRLFSRALYRLPRGDASRPTRARILVRLAQLAERGGQPADALRAWREVREVDPSNQEAKNRIDRFLGDSR